LKPGTLNATSIVPSLSKCTKIVGGWGFAQTPLYWGSLQRYPRPLAELRGLLLKGGEKEGWGREGLWILTMLETD